ncbi:MAG: DUF503 domain-containing protein [Firmicutes bacterium]|nr:DUF503 domain-containing protein [Bacillota bacterium]
MVIGVCKITLSIYGAFSLKDKRSVVKSIIGRVKARFNASIAEVGMNDTWKSAVLGIACVSNEAAHVDSMLEDIVGFIENDGRVVLINYSTERIYVT